MFEVEKRRITELYNQMKLDPKNFHSLETFEKFLSTTLDLSSDVTNEILKNQKVQYWIDRNRQNGFVYQTYPNIVMNQPEDNNQSDEDIKFIKEDKRLLPVRCDLCKFYGHLSHTCTIKEVSGLVLFQSLHS